MVTHANNINIKGIYVSKSGEYVVKKDVDLKNSIWELPDNSVLRFEGGVIKNGTITGNSIYIQASPIKIFDNVSFSGTFSSIFYVEWIGAFADGKFDNSNVFNKAFSSCIKRWKADGEIYRICSPVIINTTGLCFDCPGSIFVDGSNDGFVINVYEVNLKIGKIISLEDYMDNHSSAIKIEKGSFHSTITVGFIKGFNRGIDLCPRTSSDNEVAGIQYCVFNWQQIVCKECIVFDLDGPQEGKGLWINENQFNGGRLTGYYGLVQHGRGEKYDRPNGNVFRCVGFEGINIPISGLYRWVYDYFYDIRMNESIECDYYIIIDSCEQLLFNFKTDFSDSHIKCDSCVECKFNLNSRTLVSRKNSGFLTQSNGK